MFRIYASSAGGQSQPVMVRVSTTQTESSRFLILPPDTEEDSFDYAAPDTGEPAPEESLPFSMKVVMFTMVMVALILVVFSASLGAICRIQCRVSCDLTHWRLEGNSLCLVSVCGGESAAGSEDPEHRDLAHGLQLQPGARPADPHPHPPL